LAFWPKKPLRRFKGACAGLFLFAGSHGKAAGVILHFSVLNAVLVAVCFNRLKSAYL
jgi:hypothetical protein